MELYGHLVATGFLDEGIVVPMKDIFEDIKEQFSATSVTLPSDIDLLSSCYEMSGVPRDEDHKTERPPRPKTPTRAPTDSGYQSIGPSPDLHSRLARKESFKTPRSSFPTRDCSTPERTDTFKRNSDFDGPLVEALKRFKRNKQSQAEE